MLENNLHIYSLGLKTHLSIQGVPRELDYKPQSSFEAIQSPGRNNPFYHFTGSEDSITMELDWYSDGKDLSRIKVIESCRWLEAHTKNDGYEQAFSPVLLIWGSSLFDQVKSNNSESWIIVDASYKLGPFSRPHDMMPVQAYQTLVLKRVTSTNRRRAQILKVNEPRILQGIENPDNLTALYGSNYDSNTTTISFTKEREVITESEKSRSTLRGSLNDGGNGAFKFVKETELEIQSKLPKFLNQPPKSGARVFLESRGKELIKNAANTLANNIIYSAVKVVGNTINIPDQITSEIRPLGGGNLIEANFDRKITFDSRNIGKDFLPDYLK
jgi:hypothetical protein